MLILGLLSAIEASTCLCRRSGYLCGNPTAGLMLQNSLSLASRALMFIFLPLLGAMADGKMAGVRHWVLAVAFLFVPLLIGGVICFRSRIEGIFIILVQRINANGTLYRRAVSAVAPARIDSPRRLRSRRYNEFKSLVCVSFIPYYAAWPVVIYLLSIFPENRGLLLGLSGLFNGINTILMAVFIDPQLARIGNHERIVVGVYDDLVWARLYAAVIVLILLVVWWIAP